MAKLRKTSLLPVLLLLLTFVGQVSASATVHCNMQLMGATDTSMDSSGMDFNMANMSDMDHAAMGHEMPPSDESAKMMMDCCQLGNDCSMGSCVTIFMLSDFAKVDISGQSQSISASLPTTTSRQITNLFRPPITA